nr:hypothetical protein [Clostridium botulinum]
MQVVKKNQNDISEIEDQVIGRYAKVMITRDIETHYNSTNKIFKNTQI